MADKSPHDAHHAKKSAKSIKEKRAERRAKDQGPASQLPPTQMARLIADQAPKRHG